MSVVLLSNVGVGRLPRGGLVITGKETARWCVLPDWRQSETLRNHHFTLSLVCWCCTDAGCVFPESEARPSAGSLLPLHRRQRSAEHARAGSHSTRAPQHRLVLLLAWVISPNQLTGCLRKTLPGLGCDGDLKPGLEPVIYVDLSCS